VAGGKAALYHVGVGFVEDAQQSLQEQRPPATARSHLRCSWVQRVSPTGPPFSHRELANGCVELSVVLGGGRLILSGPRRQPKQVVLAPGTTLVGVRFRLGAASRVLGVPVSEFVDEEVELADVWGRTGHELAGRVDASASPEEAARLLAAAVAARGREAAEVDSLVLESVARLRPGGAGGVRELCSDLFVSERQLRRRAVVALGYGPKTLQRILRFQGFLALIDSPQSRMLGLGRLAGMLGYADQAHLTRECVGFTGLPPQQFLAEDSAICLANHDHSASYSELRQTLVGHSVARAG
jgi:AraC-like DNA-binding protein